MTQLTERADGTGDWVYCICANVDEHELHSILEGMSGVDGEPTRSVVAGELTAVVGSVDLTRFGQEGLRRSLNDLDRLEDIARAHHGVIQRVAERRSVAPTRLATVYSDDHGVREMLRQHRESLAAALALVDRCQEWGVKAFVQREDQDTGADETPGQARAGQESAGAGTAYLRRRQAALSARDTSRRAAVAGAEALHSRLAAEAIRARRHRPQDPHLSGDDRSMVLNAAYLLDDSDAQAFRSTVASAAEAHPELAVAITGPWPPYSFAVIDDQLDNPDPATSLEQGP